VKVDDRDQGYILLHRKSLDSQVWQDPNLWYVWCWCLMRATWKERWVTVVVGTSTTQVKLLPGQFLFGRHSAARALRMKPSSVRNRMAKLKNLGNLDIKEDSHGSVVTIVNWQTYQVRGESDGQPTGQPEDNRRTTVGQPQDTNNKGNKVNNGKKEKTKTPAAAPPGVVPVGKGKRKKRKKSVFIKNNPFGPTGVQPPTPIDLPEVLNTPDWIKTFGEWVEARIEIGKPLTERAVKMQLENMAKWGVEGAIASMRRSIENGWQGLFEVDHAGVGKKGKGTSDYLRPAAEVIARERKRASGE